MGDGGGGNDGGGVMSWAVMVVMGYGFGSH